MDLHFKKIKLACLRQVAQSTKSLKLLKVGLADLGAGPAQLLNGDKLLAGLLTSGKVKGRRLAKAAYGHKGRGSCLSPTGRNFVASDS